MLTLKSKSGNRFKLHTKTSSIRFPEITKKSVISIAFSALHTNGTPKFSTVLEHHPHVNWESVLPFSLEEGRYSI